MAGGNTSTLVGSPPAMLIMVKTASYPNNSSCPAFVARTLSLDPVALSQRHAIRRREGVGPNLSTLMSNYPWNQGYAVLEPAGADHCHHYLLVRHHLLASATAAPTVVPVARVLVPAVVAMIFLVLRNRWRSASKAGSAHSHLASWTAVLMLLSISTNKPSASYCTAQLW